MWTEKAKDIASHDLEIQVINSDQFAESFSKPACADYGTLLKRGLDVFLQHVLPFNIFFYFCSILFGCQAFTNYGMLWMRRQLLYTSTVPELYARILLGGTHSQ